MIFHEFRYEFWYEIFARTLLGTPAGTISWNHARYHGFGPLFMGEIICEIRSKEYREEYREEYNERIEDLYEFLIEFMGAVRRRAVSDGGRPFCSCCSRAPASLSACLFGRAKVPISDTLVLSHTQFLLPASLVSHELESQQPRCDLSADSDSVSLATAGGASSVQV